MHCMPKILDRLARPILAIATTVLSLLAAMADAPHGSRSRWLPNKPREDGCWIPTTTI